MTPAGSAFAIGTGRCGTHLVAELLGSEPGVRACHEADPLDEARHRYCAWNGLPGDDAGLLALKRAQIASARRAGELFFESSAYLSMSVRTLFDAFGSRFVMLTRHPADTVNSLWVKGWYDGAPARAPHHVFSRIVPAGDALARWQRLTRIGKLAWYWSALNRRALAELESLPAANRRLLRIEDLDFDAYRRLTEFLGIGARRSPEEFGAVLARRPGAFEVRREVASWSARERDEFRREVADVALRLGYDADPAAAVGRR